MLKQSKLQLLVATFIVLFICGIACRSKKSEFIPKAPNYNDTTMWVTADGDTT